MKFPWVGRKAYEEVQAKLERREQDAKMYLHSLNALVYGRLTVEQFVQGVPHVTTFEDAHYADIAATMYWADIAATMYWHKTHEQ